MTITRDDLKTAKTRGIMFLDGEDFYENHYQCVEHPRLTIVRSGPRGRASKSNPHTRTFYVDGMECPDLDAVVTMLNATPHPKREDLARHQAETSSVTSTDNPKESQG